MEDELVTPVKHSCGCSCYILSGEFIHWSHPSVCLSLNIQISRFVLSSQTRGVICQYVSPPLWSNQRYQTRCTAMQFFHIIHDPQRIHSANKLVPHLMVVKRFPASKGQEETLSLLSWLMTNYLQNFCQFCSVSTVLCDC